MESFKDRLSTRARNGISRCYDSQVLDRPELIAVEGPGRLVMTVQLGPKSIKEIALALYESGYIDGAGLWPIKF